LISIELGLSFNSFTCFFITCSLESSNLFLVTSFFSSFESFLSLDLLTVFFCDSLVAFSKLLFLYLSFLSLNLQKDFSMFSYNNLLLLFILNRFVSCNMLSNLLLFFLLILNFLVISYVLSNLFFLPLFNLNLFISIYMLCDFLLLLLLFLFCSNFLENFSMFGKFFLINRFGLFLLLS
jgi:hypothetical protein